MHYAKDKDGKFPAMPKGEKPPEPPPSLEKTNEIKLELAKAEVEERNKPSVPPKEEKKEEKKKRKK